DAHRKGAPTEDVRALHAADRGKARLYDTNEIISDFVRLEDVGGKTEIGRGELRIGRLELDHGHLCFGRQIVSLRVHFRADVGERFVPVVIQFQASRDG